MNKSNDYIGEYHKRTMAVARAYDEHMVRFLKKHGINVDLRNVQQSVRDLEKSGYKVLVEAKSTGLQVTTYEFFLTKIVDQTTFKVSYDIKVGSDE